MKSLYERMGGFDGILACIKPFYADVRQHAELGPVFNQTIEDWPAHMKRIAGFWARQTGGPSDYDGGFAGAHLRLGIPPELVDRWLELWRFNCGRQLNEPERTEMLELAHQLGSNLQRILAGRPGLMPGSSFGKNEVTNGPDSI